MDARDAPGADSELNSVLDAIADDVHRYSAAARDQIMTEFAAAIAQARKHLPRHARAAAVGALRNARATALAVVKRNTALELAGRKKAAVAARRKARRRAATTYPKQPHYHVAPLLH